MKFDSGDKIFITPNKPTNESCDSDQALEVVLMRTVFEGNVALCLQ